MKKTVTLKNHEQFKEVYDYGNSKANKYLVMYVKENHLSFNRVGYTVTKKVGNSVVRHHIKRLLRESYRLNEEMFINEDLNLKGEESSSGLDIVIVARVSANSASFHEIESSLIHVGRLHRLCGKNN